MAKTPKDLDFTANVWEPNVVGERGRKNMKGWIVISPQKKCDWNLVFRGEFLEFWVKRLGEEQSDMNFWGSEVQDPLFALRIQGMS